MQERITERRRARRSKGVPSTSCLAFCGHKRTHGPRWPSPESRPLKQQDVCWRFGSSYVPSPTDSKLGIALSTLGLEPLNALGHP
jgi:hypothetical protein